MSMKTVLMVILLFMVAVLSGCDKKPALEVGQVWETVYGGDNPFDPKSIVLRKIVALDSGYVQYVRVAEWADGLISSMEEGVFRACDAKLVSNEPAPATGFIETGTGEALVIISSGKDCALCDAGSGRICPHGGIDIQLDNGTDGLVVTWSDPNDYLYRIAEAVSETFTICTDSGRELVLTFEGDELKITGDADMNEAAQMFFNEKLKYIADDYIKSRTIPAMIEYPTWGKGELPADHQEFFGDSNTARLDYVQNMVLDKHAAILKVLAVRVLALEAVDPNAMRLEALESGMETLIDVGHDTVLTDVEAVE